MRRDSSARMSISAGVRRTYEEGRVNAMQGRRHNESSRRLMADAKSGRVWLNQGSRSCQVAADEVESYVLSGWQKGRLVKSR